MERIIPLLFLALFVVLSAIFAACEVAFLSISNVRLFSLVDKKVPGSESLARLRQNRRRVVISLLIGNNVANVAASALATALCMELFGEEGLAVAVGLSSFLLLTVGDIMPKSTATTHGERIALAFAPAMEMFYWLVYPLVLLFEGFNRLIPGVYATATKIERFTEEEVRSAVRLGEKHQSITSKEREMIENVLSFNDRTVGQVMTPKGKVIGFKHNEMVPEAHKKAIESVYTRFPVFDGGKPVGVVSMKLLGRALYQHPDWRVDKASVITIKARTHDRVSDTFARLQEAGRNIAIVYDNENKYAGIVTVDDLLEELVGEMQRKG